MCLDWPGSSISVPTFLSDIIFDFGTVHVYTIELGQVLKIEIYKLITIHYILLFTYSEKYSCL